MTEKVQFVDFGAPEQFGTHVFRVEIPAARTEPVRIIEDYGYRGLEEGAPLNWRPSADTVAGDGIPRDEERVILPRAVWSGIAESARRAFNNRLKALRSLSVAGMPAPISWSVSSARSSASSPGQPRRPMASRFP